MQAKQLHLIERSLLVLGIFAFIALATLVAAAIKAHSEGVTANTIVEVMVVGDVAPLFFPSSMICVASLWLVLYLRLGRE